jgi:protein deglycase
MKVNLFLADGFEEIEAITVIDILRRAKIEIETISITGKREVIGAHNITVLADILYEQADFTNIDMLVLPGGQPGTKNLSQHAGLKEQLLRFSSQKKWIAAICAAPTVLGNHGILEGISAVCYPGCEVQLIGAEINPEDSTVVDRNIITSRGPGTAFEFAFKLVEVLKNVEIVRSIKKDMIFSL